MAEKTNIAKETPPRGIEEDIARTREEMSGTVNAIQEKLSPSHLKAQAKYKIRASTVDKVKGAASRFGQSARGTGSSIVDTVKSNPVPVAMMGLGFAWLLYNTRTHGNGGVIIESGTQVKEKAGEISERAQAKIGELSGLARERGSQFAGRARLSAQKMSSAARESALGAKTRLQQMIQDNPFGITLAAFAIGSAVGFGLPESRKEKEMMGSASESLFERAKETAQRTLQKAQHAAEKAVKTAEAELKS